MIWYSEHHTGQALFVKFVWVERKSKKIAPWMSNLYTTCTFKSVFSSGRGKKFAASDEWFFFSHALQFDNKHISILTAGTVVRLPKNAPFVTSCLSSRYSVFFFLVSCSSWTRFTHTSLRKEIAKQTSRGRLASPHAQVLLCVWCLWESQSIAVFVQENMRTSPYERHN